MIRYVLLFLALVGNGWGATLTVCASGCGYTGGATAYSAATNGDTIMGVGDGAFNDWVPGLMTKNVNIVSDSGKRIWNYTPSGTGEIVSQCIRFGNSINFTSSVTIKGFTFTNTKSGIQNFLVLSSTFSGTGFVYVEDFDLYGSYTINVIGNSRTNTNPRITLNNVRCFANAPKAFNCDNAAGGIYATNCIATGSVSAINFIVEFSNGVLFNSPAGDSASIPVVRKNVIYFNNTNALNYTGTASPSNISYSASTGPISGWGDGCVTFSGNPFIGPPSDYYLSDAALASIKSGGTPIAGVTTDISGYPYDSTAPSMGCYQYRPNFNFVDWYRMMYQGIGVFQ